MVTIPKTVTIQLQPFLPYMNLAPENFGILLSTILNIDKKVIAVDVLDDGNISSAADLNYTRLNKIKKNLFCPRPTPEIPLPLEKFLDPPHEIFFDLPQKHFFAPPPIFFL